jgi:peptide/nickel transport system ATP-binding protein
MRGEDDKRGERLQEITGIVPPLFALPPGCAFAPRCPQATARCREAAPPAFAPEEGRIARCWLAEPSFIGSAAGRPELHVVGGAP